MKLKNLQWVACALVASAALVGCSKDISSDFDSNTGANQSGDVRIKTNLVLDDVASSADFRGLQEELRLSIINKEKTAEGKYNGVRFQFENDEKVKLYTYFKQNGQIFVADPVEITIKGTKEVGSGSAKTTYWAGLTELKVPTGIDLSASAGEVTVAGAIGVEGIDANGKATVKPMEVEADGDVEFQASVPMYFPEMKLNKADTTLVQTNADGSKTVPHLRFYGALLRLSFKSQMYDPIRLSQAVFQTEAFTTEGQMNLTTASETADPEWTTSQGGTTDQKINFGDVVFPGERSSAEEKANGVKNAFIWIKPGSYGTGETERELTIHLRENDYTLNSTLRSEAITRKYKVKALNRKVYSIPEISVDGGLIYTEFIFGARDIEVEVYNSSNKEVNLRDYYHNIQTYGLVIGKGSYTPIRAMSTNLLSDRLAFSYDKENRSGIAGNGLPDTGNTESVSREQRWSNRVKIPAGVDFILKPGEIALFLPGAITITDKMKENATYIFKFKSTSSLTDKSHYTSFMNDGLAVGYTLTKGGAFVSGSLDNWIDSNDEGDSTKIADVYMFFKDRTGRRNITQGRVHRRADRNFPRKYWAKGEFGSDSDWVGNTLAVDAFQDLGFRYGRYYAPTHSGGPYVKRMDPSFSGIGEMWMFTDAGTYAGGSLRLAAPAPKFWTQGVAH